MATRNVWYTLVNVAGEELSPADVVQMPTAAEASPDANPGDDSDEIVAAFRKVVRQANPTLLAKVDASQLTVFADRAAFEAETERASKRQSLTPGSSLAKYGASEAEAIVVQVPSLPAVPADLIDLLQQAAYLSLLDTSSTSSKQSVSFKEKLCEAYDCAVPAPNDGEPAMLRCLLLDTALPAELVGATTLVRNTFSVYVCKLLEIEDADDPRANLMLFKPLRHAFNKFQITFHYDRELDAFRLQVLDPELLSQSLFGKLTYKQRKLLMRNESLPKKWRADGPCCAPGTSFDLQMTFGDLAGRALAFRSPTRPFKRCLNFHARLASINGIDSQWMSPDEGQFEDFWSEGVTADDTMEFYLGSL